MNLANEPVRSYPKQQQVRKTRQKPKRARRSEFSHATRQTIILRDNASCVRCGRPYDSIHHIHLRSRGGSNHHTNGVCVCVRCHQFAHSGAEGEAWFKEYQERVLLNGGMEQ